MSPRSPRSNSTRSRPSSEARRHSRPHPVYGRLGTRDVTRWLRINIPRTAMTEVNRHDSGLRHHELSRNKSPRLLFSETPLVLRLTHAEEERALFYKKSRFQDHTCSQSLSLAGKNLGIFQTFIKRIIVYVLYDKKDLTNPKRSGVRGFTIDRSIGRGRRGRIHNTQRIERRGNRRGHEDCSIL
jgi:hypothetical protein